MKPIIFLLLFLTSSGVFAEGGRGDFIVAAGKRYDLADLHFKPVAGEFFRPDEALTKQIELVRRLLKSELAYTVLPALAEERPENLPSESQMPLNRFFEDEIYKDNIVYKFVPTLPAECSDTMDVGGLKEQQFGCTKGHVTWIIPELFKPLDIEQRASGIIHERLHAFRSSEPHEVISPFVSGTVLLQYLYEKAAQLPTLSDKDVSTLNAMLLAADQLGFITTQRDLIHVQKRGGGTWYCDPNGASNTLGKCGAGPNVFIGVGVEVINSHIDDRADLAILEKPTDEKSIGHGMTGYTPDNVSIVNSDIATGGRIVNSQIENSRIGGRRRSNVDFENATLVRVRVSGGEIRFSKLVGLDLGDINLAPRIGEGGQIVHSFITFNSNANFHGDEIQDGAILNYAYLSTFRRLVIGSHARLENVHSSLWTNYEDFIVGANTVLMNFEAYTNKDQIFDANLKIQNCTADTAPGEGSPEKWKRHYKTDSCGFESETK